AISRSTMRSASCSLADARGVRETAVPGAIAAAIFSTSAGSRSGDEDGGCASATAHDTRTPTVTRLNTRATEPRSRLSTAAQVTTPASPLLVGATWSASEELKNLGHAFGVEFHHVTGAQLFEQLLDVLIPQTNAAVRFRESDRARIVGAVNAEPLDAQPNPSRR